jgi:hypothetical protein
MSGLPEQTFNEFPVCGNCKHVSAGPVSEATSMCKHPRNGSRVTGKMQQVTCYSTRASMALCGPEGLWFEAKGADRYDPPKPVFTLGEPDNG